MSGIYHFSEPVQMSKYDMAVAMADEMGVEHSHITGIIIELD